MKIIGYFIMPMSLTGLALKAPLPQIIVSKATFPQGKFYVPKHLWFSNTSSQLDFLQQKTLNWLLQYQKK
jgi:hypothetical protein